MPDGKQTREGKRLTWAHPARKCPGRTAGLVPRWCGQGGLVLPTLRPGSSLPSTAQPGALGPLGLSDPLSPPLRHGILTAPTSGTTAVSEGPCPAPGPWEDSGGQEPSTPALPSPCKRPSAPGDLGPVGSPHWSLPVGQGAPGPAPQATPRGPAPLPRASHGAARPRQGRRTKALLCPTSGVPWRPQATAQARGPRGTQDHQGGLRPGGRQCWGRRAPPCPGWHWVSSPCPPGAALPAGS